MSNLIHASGAAVVARFNPLYFPSAAEGRVKRMGTRETGAPTGSE